MVVVGLGERNFTTQLAEASGEFVLVLLGGTGRSGEQEPRPDRPRHRRQVRRGRPAAAARDARPRR